LLTLKERIGVDVLGDVPIEKALAWAGENEVRYLDFCADHDVHHLFSFDADRVRTVRDLCERHRVHLGLHTLSGMNVAEFSPFVSDAVDEYLKAYVDLAERLACEWIVVHAGYHFTADHARRREASLAHLRTAVAHAEKAGVTLLLENMNGEPEDAEVQYLATKLEECQLYFRALQSERLGWSFTVNHAHMEPEGIDGFLDDLPFERCREVRLADNLGDREAHLQPGDGNIDFAGLFARLEGAGYAYHYAMAFGTLDDMLRGRDYLLAKAQGA
jgi:sugar phosphate isomerase/epimerase